MTVARVVVFIPGLVAGYLGSGAVLGPGVLSVSIGIILGTVLASSLQRCT
ncbi:MAG: hypothetical protein QOI95_3944 [Acidimicrobiaceae bacterium]|jgi:hypothetical protein